MVRVLLDACVPHWLRRELREFEVETAHFAGLDQLPDTVLLDAIGGRYDALVTLDSNLTYQQKIEGRSVAVIVLRVAEQTPEAFQALMPQLQAAIRFASGGSVTVVGSPT